MGPSDLKTTATASPPALLAGGRYELHEPIGEGGNGTVYRGIQRPLGREVAIKVLRKDAGPTEMARFAREISLVQRLEHPNTVRLYDFGTREDGSPFIVFELLRGRTLDAEIARGPMAPARVAKIAVQILKALMEAHGHGIVHRDIKPANVLLVDYSGERDFVKVLDFGVARGEDEGRGAAKITRHGQIVGTPAYMAPEQVFEGPVSPRTDLYALGLLLAEALTARPVFDGSDGALWIAQTSKEPVPLSPLVRGSILGAIIEKATRKEPEQRYASAREMIEDIENATLDERSAATARAAEEEEAPATERIVPRTASAPAGPSAPAAPTYPDAAPTDPTFYVERVPSAGPPPTPLRSAPASATTAPASNLTAAKHLAMGAFAAMVLLMMALIMVQLRFASHPLKRAAIAVEADRVSTAGWVAAPLQDVEQAGVRTQIWAIHAPHDMNMGFIYLSTFPDEASAKAFGGFQNTYPSMVTRMAGAQVLRVSARDRATAERILSLVVQ